MSIFPSDRDDEDFEDENNHYKIKELIQSFEAGETEKLTADDLIDIYNFYAHTYPFGQTSPGELNIKKVLTLGLNQFPYVAVFAVHLAELMLQEGNLRMAKKYLHQGKEYNQFDAGLLFVECVIAFKENKESKSQYAYMDASMACGEDEELFEDFLELLLRHKIYVFAFTVCETLLKFDGYNPDYIIERFLEMDLPNEELPKLLAIIETAIEKDPYASDIWYYLGSVYMQQKNYAKAHWAFDYCITINVDDVDGWHGFFESLYELEDYPKFIEKFVEQRNTEFGKTLEDLDGLLAWSYYEVGNIPESRKLYRNILKTNPSDTECWYSMGLTYLYEKNFETAIHYLKHAWELERGEADYGLVLASCYLGVSDERAWKIIYAYLAEEFPENEEVWLDWSGSLYTIGEFDAALEKTQEGFKYIPHSYKLMYRLGALCYLGGQTEAALTLIETALNSNSKEHDLLFEFAPQLKKSGKILQLISAYTNPKL